MWSFYNKSIMSGKKREGGDGYGKRDEPGQRDQKLVMTNIHDSITSFTQRVYDSVCHWFEGSFTNFFSFFSRKDSGN